MVVSGIYQDITNGGRTAKANTALQSTECALVYRQPEPGSRRQYRGESRLEYSQIFDPARVTDTASFVSQTVGNTVQQLKTVTMVTVVVGVGLIRPDYVAVHDDAHYQRQ